MSLLEKLNNAVVAFIVLALFFWLAYSTYQRDHADVVAYPDASVERLNKMSYAATPLLQRQAKAYKELYNISEEEISNPVNIWR